jgi:D-xylose 1-dehydrogenase (NADP+, D-xylono-1,5-lactone-forming)
MSKKIRWGIISAARIAESAVIPAIHASSNGEVAAVASRDLAKGQAYAQRNNIPKVYSSYEELLADPDIDAVYNPLPNGLHAEWSIKAAQAGKHVLCEKPLASNAAEAEEMAAAAREANVLLAEAFMYRFNPQIQQVKQMIAEGAVGKVNMVNAVFSFAMPQETEDIRLDKSLAGGSLMDVGCYCIDSTRYLLGEEPLEVKAFADIGAKSGVDETMVGVMRFPSGALAHFDCGFRTFFTQTFEIRGDGGRIYLERAYVPHRPDANADVTIRYWRGQVGSEDSGYQEIKVEKPDQYVLMVEDFADAILNNRPMKFPIEDSIAQMRAIDMLYASLK